jgi:outer membrane protein OmpA-like peptidoglycan-associated protein
VEILTEDQHLLEPVELATTMREPVANNLDLEVSAPYRITAWSATITGDGYARTYGPFHATTQRINATPILGDRTHGTYTATIAATLEDGASITGEATFDLDKTKRPPVTTDRYSILFEYDESKTVEQYERFLRQTVAPALPKNALVYVHGHTDMIGDYDYNADLSLRRAETTATILEDEVRKNNREDVLFDTYGFGEDIDEAPFENESPEERHYNRTVVIDVFEGM